MRTFMARGRWVTGGPKKRLIFPLVTCYSLSTKKQSSRYADYKDWLPGLVTEENLYSLTEKPNTKEIWGGKI